MSSVGANRIVAEGNRIRRYRLARFGFVDNEKTQRYASLNLKEIRVLTKANICEEDTIFLNIDVNPETP